MTNTLWYRDNLDILRHGIGTERVDRVYLDPPFTGQANCNPPVQAPDRRAGARPDRGVRGYRAWERDRRARLRRGADRLPHLHRAISPRHAWTSRWHQPAAPR